MSYMAGWAKSYVGSLPSSYRCTDPSTCPAIPGDCPHSGTAITGDSRWGTDVSDVTASCWNGKCESLGPMCGTDACDAGVCVTWLNGGAQSCAALPVPCDAGSDSACSVTICVEDSGGERAWGEWVSTKTVACELSSD